MLNDVEHIVTPELNLLNDEIIAIIPISDTQLFIQTEHGYLYLKNETLYYPKRLSPTAKALATPIKNRAEIEAHQALEMPKALPPL